MGHDEYLLYLVCSYQKGERGGPIVRRLLKTDLSVPFEDKEQAKNLGARWDSAHKTWYCPDGIDLMLFTKWLPAGFKKWERILKDRPFFDGTDDDIVF